MNMMAALDHRVISMFAGICTRCLCTIYKMSGRSLSVYKDTSASHEYLCTLIKNGHEFCKLLLKRTQIVIQ